MSLAPKWAKPVALLGMRLQVLSLDVAHYGKALDTVEYEARRSGLLHELDRIEAMKD